MIYGQVGCHGEVSSPPHSFIVQIAVIYQQTKGTGLLAAFTYQLVTLILNSWVK